MLIESRLQLHGAAMSVGDYIHTYIHTLDVLFDHLRDQDLPAMLARLANRSERPISISCVPCKLLQCAVSSKIYSHLVKNC